MEKATKKISEVEIEMKDGTKKSLADLTQADLVNVKLDGKEDKDKNPTSITLKRGVVNDTTDVYTERRLFKYGNNPKVVLYDLDLPKTKSALDKYTLEAILAYFWKSARIDTDHEQAGGEPISQEAKTVIALIKKAEKGEKLTEPEKAVVRKWYQDKYGAPQEKVEAVKNGMKKHGFTK